MEEKSTAFFGNFLEESILALFKGSVPPARETTLIAAFIPRSDPGYRLIRDSPMTGGP
jgi:hypothetical protein